MLDKKKKKTIDFKFTVYFDDLIYCENLNATNSTTLYSCICIILNV